MDATKRRRDDEHDGAARGHSASQPTFDELPYYPTRASIRGDLGRETVLESRRAVHVWKTRKMTPIYAFPAADVTVQLDITRDE